MSVHHIERTSVLGLGFVGAALAMCIAPGDIFLWVATGIVLGLFSRAVFINSFGGESLPQEKRHRPTLTVTHH